MPPQSWSRLALSTIENSGSWGSILGRRICSCSSSLQRLIIIATPVFCQRPWIQGTGFRLKACLLHLFLPSLYLSLSLSLSIYFYISIYIYIHMCVCTIVLKVRLLKRSWFSMWRFAYVLSAFALFVFLALCIHVYMYKPCRPPT